MKTFSMYAIAALLLLGTGLASAQTTNLDLGIKAGVNYGTLPSNVKELSNEAGKMGFNIGAFARIGNTFYFQPEVNFSTFKSEYTFSSEKYQPKFNQIDVPLMVGYNILGNDSFKFRVSVGPDLTYTLNTPDAPPANTYQDFNIGTVLNAGMDIGLFTIDARYNRGLTELNKNLAQNIGVFNLSIGFLIK